MLEDGAARSRPGSDDAGRTISIDLNCDMGEGMATDAEIFPFISSANIACGAHAGDEDTMRRTVSLALEQGEEGVAIGAHPSYPDRAGFGRVDMLDKGLRPDELPGIIYSQLEALQKICAEFGVRLHHVKPHGALYNRAARDAAVSALICQAVAAFDPSLLLYGLSGSLMRTAAGLYRLRFISEVFADRTYQPDGSLTPRSAPHALIEDAGAAIAQVIRLVREGRVTPVAEAQVSLSGAAADITLAAGTVCLHGDGPHAAAFAKSIHRRLASEGIPIHAPRQF